MIGIRHKLMLGFGGLVCIVAFIGVLIILQINDLGQAIDVILKENYRSVVACQDMKESLERMDSGILFTLAGNEPEGNRLITEYRSRFLVALDAELDNITLPSEHEMSLRIKNLFEAYLKSIPLVLQTQRTLEERQEAYFDLLQPVFLEIKKTAQDILDMNQKNMSDANDAARRRADSAHRNMLMAIIISAIFAILYSYLAHRWILKPINKLIESTNEVKAGNLDLVLEQGSKDEIGMLSESFNEMITALRQVRNTDRLNLLRTRRATEEVFKSLPTPIVVFDLDGRVEIATETAIRQFGLKPGVLAEQLEYVWLTEMIRKALDENRIIERDSKKGYIQRFIDNREYFFQPVVVPITAGSEPDGTAGLALIFKDMTQVREQQELKRGVVSTVSHQLKTPLTSLRMSVYLLLEQRVGALNEKQTELLMAARDDSDRLVGILNDLLDLNRIESGKSNLSPEPVSPQRLVHDSIEPFLIEAREKGVDLQNDVKDDLPDVLADFQKIRYVFSNLLSNALRFTDPGGYIIVRARQEQDYVRFSVEDSGKGIAKEHLNHLFEQFYRVPGQDDKSGIGLGLAIVREIVRAHGGDVGVESMLDKGSTFNFSLPLINLKTNRIDK
jgi:NtrC-family two-component system sensor histidine kinase KinB